MAAKSEEEAVELACDQVSFGDMEMDEARCEKEIKDGNDLERARYHASYIVEAE